jgi:thiamine monophosphate kinase
MDNTDGIGQSLTELSEASHCALIVREEELDIPRVVQDVGHLIGRLPREIIFNGGADFSLVGTLRGRWTSQRASEYFGHPLAIIGCVEDGRGVWLEQSGRQPLAFRGWNYFQPA